ncbi:MAG: hypothetical protein CL678_08200 [Bdellovibrionaceae bacterium]|nr:hypothetical protein [Pseudobdellovibrionaceae bacterium]|tara:strand:- start:1891 stop:2178 length:288 start_codon:yes stop_codon:yes gene_type:complete
MGAPNTADIQGNPELVKEKAFHFQRRFGLHTPLDLEKNQIALGAASFWNEVLLFGVRITGNPIEFIGVFTNSPSDKEKRFARQISEELGLPLINF